MHTKCNNFLILIEKYAAVEKYQKTHRNATLSGQKIATNTTKQLRLQQICFFHIRPEPNLAEFVIVNPPGARTAFPTLLKYHKKITVL